MPAIDPAAAALVARLGDALGAATRPFALQQELEAAVNRVRLVYGAAACSFAQVEPDGATLRFVAADGAGAAAIVGVTLPVSRGIAGWAALSGEAILVADVADDDRFARDVAESTDYVPSTILAAPVVDEHGETAGVIEVLDPAVRQSDSGQDLAVLGLVADQLASVIRLSALYDALGTGLLRTLADPEQEGSFAEGIAALVGEEGGAGLTAVAQAFRDLAERGPEEARLAERVLREVAAYASRRR
ncbi:MAG: hypothetical protein QOK15_1988 [Nocardioidaceae bacterium]|jgi:GAF domain-containing protein|nr:hypothetical protein [Nocardioidaceae bacterium]